jgi:hypothetical protein
MHPLISAMSPGRRVVLPADVSATDEQPSPATAVASITFNRDGTISDQTGVIGAWNTLRVPTVGDAYEIKHTRSSGLAFSNAAAANDTFVALSANRTWENTRESLGPQTTIGTWTIRLAGDAASEVTATGTVTASVTL